VDVPDRGGVSACSDEVPDHAAIVAVRRAQVVIAARLSILIFSELPVIIVIDHPFAGSVKVEPDALLAVLVDFAASSPR